MSSVNATSGQLEMQRNASEPSLLSKLSIAQVQRLLAVADAVTFEQDEVILRAGEPSQSLYLLTSGSVSVDAVTRYYSIRVQALGPGDVFGWSSLLESYDTLFQVRARERCSALRFDGAIVTAMCHDDPAFGVQLLRGVLRIVAGRVLGAESRLAEFCGVSEHIA
jgi:CRP-like cAMP-binding protein